MHPILPFYAALSLLALLGLRTAQRDGRTIVWLAGWGSMSIVLLATIFREITGDTLRYNQDFHQLASQGFGEMWASVDTNLLFTLLMWGLAQLGTDPLWFIIPITLFCIVMMRYSLRQILGPTDTAIAMLLYSAYPFFIFYVSSGLKQALAMALIMQGYICLFRNRHLAALFWLFLAPFFHMAALLIYPFLLLHQLLWLPFFGHRRVLAISIGLLLLSIALSMTGLNRGLISPVASVVDTFERYEVYFMNAEERRYRAGFRLDFTLFSLLPFAAAQWLRRNGQGLSLEVSGWWLSLYALLACIYQLFAFAPYADRFASFGWYLIPAILVVMIADTKALRPRNLLILIFAFLNIAILQFYTGNNINVAI